MKRARILILALLASFGSMALAAQADAQPAVPADTAPEGKSLPANAMERNPYRVGDGLFSIQLGADWPLFMMSMADGSIGPTNLFWGGALSLRYMTFVQKGFALGGEAGAAFNMDYTKRRTLYTVPFTFEALWYLVRMPFEFPVGMGVGVALLNLGNYYRGDLILKPEAGAYYRVNPSWSFGVTVSYNLIFDFFTADFAQSQYGNFLDLKLSALYRL
jgi:hypothetical protein